MRLPRADVLRVFTVFTGQATKSLIFHPAIAGSISASHFAARPRKTTPGPSPGPGASKTSPARQKMLQNTKNNQTPLSLWGSATPGCLGVPATSPTWANMSTGSAMGLGGGRTPIYIWGTCWDRFGIVLELFCDNCWIVLGSIYDSFGIAFGS